MRDIICRTSYLALPAIFIPCAAKGDCITFFKTESRERLVVFIYFLCSQTIHFDRAGLIHKSKVTIVSIIKIGNLSCKDIIHIIIYWSIYKISYCYFLRFARSFTTATEFNAL